jgi:hypothetical protein
MSGERSFLRRWSSRKRQAAPRQPGKPELESQRPKTVPDTSEPEASPHSPALDPASLPPVDSIASDSDVHAFLAPGVPAEMARAALRRAWSSDPTIRDFIGLSENSWDFNAEGSMAGFGTFAPDDLERFVAQLGGSDPRKPLRPAADGAEPPVSGSDEQKSRPQAAVTQPDAAQVVEGDRSPSADAATSREAAKHETSASLWPRR